METNLPNSSSSVSIILPTFNRRNYLTRCIESILEQTFLNWELIIIDDGSTDDSWNLIEQYLEKSPNIRGLKQRNKGLPLSRNAGIQLAKGRYITFMDSDDFYKKNHLKTRVNFMKNAPAIDVLHGGFQVIGSPYVADKYDHTKKIHLSQCPLGGTIFGKREVIMELGGFRNIPYSEDGDFIDRAKLKFVVRKVHFPTYVYDRTTPGSITNTLIQRNQVA